MTQTKFVICINSNTARPSTKMSRTGKSGDQKLTDRQMDGCKGKQSGYSSY